MSLQRGMNFRGLSNISVVLMSRRASAPYDDSLSEDGAELSYEGHDVRREPGVDPKTLDQPWTLPSGKATENGQLHMQPLKQKVRWSELTKSCVQVPGLIEACSASRAMNICESPGEWFSSFECAFPTCRMKWSLRTAQKSSSELFLHGLNTLCTNATTGAASFAVHLISFTSTTSSLFHEEALA